LTSAYFNGNAPSMGQDVFYSCSRNFTVCYTAESTGFTNPWYGYPATVCAPFSDSDGDGTPDYRDNCPTIPNGPLIGTCTSGVNIGNTCHSNSDCGTGGFCSMNQEDSDGNGIGHACDWQWLFQEARTELQACQNSTPPTRIELSILDATPSNEKVFLKWKTESETDNAGFNVWRADNFVKVNDAVIPALGSSVSGSEYDFVDQWVLNGKRYFYLLEDIDTNGISTFHGPVKATPRWLYGAGN
jgi:hypothetical protein